MGKTWASEAQRPEMEFLSTSTDWARPVTTLSLNFLSDYNEGKWPPQSFFFFNKRK